jgi:hypothetical protein
MGRGTGAAATGRGAIHDACALTFFFLILGGARQLDRHRDRAEPAPAHSTVKSSAAAAASRLCQFFPSRLGLARIRRVGSARVRFRHVGSEGSEAWRPLCDALATVGGAPLAVRDRE